MGKSRVLSHAHIQNDRWLFLQCSQRGRAIISFFRFNWQAWRVSISGFTGIDSAYEPPPNPELCLKSGEELVDDCVQQVIKLLADQVNVILWSLFGVQCV